jgi:ATP-dependent protease ClpP protease subunit
VNFRLAQGRRVQLRLPLSPLKAEMALKALENWQQPVDEARERRWYKIGNQAAGAPTQVNIFDEISWWGISAQEFVDELAGITGDIEVHINSPGGDAFDGITIYNALAARPGVTTVVDGIAASAASVIAMAGSTRSMSPGSMMMIHDALALCVGNAADMRETAGLLDKVSDSIAGVYAKHAGKTTAEWRQAMVAEGWYTAQEAVDAGLAHKLTAQASDAPEPEPSGSPWDRSVFVNWHGPRPQNADADESAWDGPAAMSAASKADDPAAALNAICAGKREGDPATQAAHALPHHKHQGAPPNRHGVSAALGRIDGTEGLTNKAAAEAHLKAHQAAMGGGTDDRSEVDRFLHDLLEGAL